MKMTSVGGRMSDGGLFRIVVVKCRGNEENRPEGGVFIPLCGPGEGARQPQDHTRGTFHLSQQPISLLEQDRTLSRSLSLFTTSERTSFLSLAGQPAAALGIFRQPVTFIFHLLLAPFFLWKWKK